MAHPKHRSVERDDERAIHLREVSAEDVGTSVGAELRHARQRHGVDLRLVADELRIRYEHLLALEEGRFDALPGATYVYGFLRAYGNYLGLDGEELIRRFKQETGGLRQKPSLDFPAPAEEGRVPTGPLLLIALALAAAGYAGWYYVTSVDRVALDRVPEVPARLAETAPPASPPPVLTPATDEPTSEPSSLAPSRSASAPLAGGPSATAEQAPEAPTTEAPAAVALASAPSETSPPGPSAPAVSEPAAPEPAPPPPSAPPTSSALATAVPEPPQESLAPLPTPAPATFEASPASPPATVEASPAPAPEDVAEAPPPTLPSEPERGQAPSAPLALSPAVTPPVPSVVPERRASVVQRRAGLSAAAGAPAVSTPGSTPAAQTAPQITAALETPAPPPPAVASAERAPRVFGQGNTDARIVIEAQAESWVQVTGRDNELLLTRILRPGDRYLVPDRPGLKLMTGNAGGLRILVDGREAPPLGGLGDVRRDVALEPERLLAGSALAR